ncbi:MAG TPA: family 16 glycoside hydrolase, partial [Rhizomicrobium sp.]
MKKQILIGLGLAAACAFAAMAQDSGVDPAELAQIKAQHPDWAPWLSDPALAKLTLAGPKMPNSNWRADDIRRPQPPFVETGTACAAAPPGDADVLFDGHNISKWTGDHVSEWSLKDGILTTGARVYNFLHTKASYGDAQIHV